MPVDVEKDVDRLGRAAEDVLEREQRVADRLRGDDVTLAVAQPLRRAPDEEADVLLHRHRLAHPPQRSEHPILLEGLQPDQRKMRAQMHLDQPLDVIHRRCVMLHGLQVADEFGGALVALVGILLEHLGHHSCQSWVEGLGVERRQVRRVVEDLAQQAALVARRERQRVGQQLVEGDAETPEVGVEAGHPLELFGRHVGHRADARRRPILRMRHQPGNAEVEDLHRPVRPPDQVRRLDVAVDRQPLMRVVERFADLADDVQGLLQRQRPALGEQGVERLPVHTLDDREDHPLGLAQTVFLDDPGVAERAHDAQFVGQQPTRLFVLRVRHADGHRFRPAVRRRRQIARRIDGLESAAAERPLDQEVAQPLARAQGPVGSHRPPTGSVAAVLRGARPARRRGRQIAPARSLLLRLLSRITVPPA